MHLIIYEFWLFIIGVGFAELATKLIAIGAKYGNVPASNVLPSGRTVSRHVDDVVTSKKAALKKELAEIGRFGVMTDMWTHEASTTPYITVTLHLIN